MIDISVEIRNLVWIIKISALLERHGYAPTGDCVDRFIGAAEIVKKVFPDESQVVDVFSNFDFDLPPEIKAHLSLVWSKDKDKK